MIRYLGYRAAAALLPRVPARIGYPLVGLLADLAYWLASGTRALLTRNLAVVLGPDADARGLARTSRLAFRNLLWGYYELFHLPAVRLDQLRSRGTVDGLEHLDPGPERDTGAIIVFAHSGNLEILCQVALLQPEHRFVVVVERMADERIHRLLLAHRRSQGLETVHADRPLELLRRFRAGANLILAGDLDTTDSGTVVDYFGRPARMPHGAAKLALRTGAPLVTAAGWRGSMARPETYRIEVSPPLELAGSANSRSDVRAAVQRVVARLEETVAARPEQWLAFREIWEGP